MQNCATQGPSIRQRVRTLRCVRREQGERGDRDQRLVKMRRRRVSETVTTAREGVKTQDDSVGNTVAMSGGSTTYCCNQTTKLAIPPARLLTVSIARSQFRPSAITVCSCVALCRRKQELHGPEQGTGASKSTSTQTSKQARCKKQQDSTNNTQQQATQQQTANIRQQ